MPKIASSVAALRFWRLLMEGINATKWLATHPVDSNRANTPMNTAWVPSDPLRPPPLTGGDGVRALRPVVASDEITEFPPHTSALAAGRQTVEDDAAYVVIPH